MRTLTCAIFPDSVSAEDTMSETVDLSTIAAFVAARQAEAESIARTQAAEARMTETMRRAVASVLEAVRNEPWMEYRPGAFDVIASKDENIVVILKDLSDRHGVRTPKRAFYLMPNCFTRFRTQLMNAYPLPSGFCWTVQFDVAYWTSEDDDSYDD